MINFGQKHLISVGIFISIVIMCLAIKLAEIFTFRKFTFVFNVYHFRRNMILAIVIRITWLAIVLLFTVIAMMLITWTGRIVSDGEVGRFRRKDEIYVKVDDSYKHFDGGNQENIGYQLRKRKSYKQKENTKKQKEISTQVKIQTKIYENGPCKFIELDFLTNHFFYESFISLVTMIIQTETDEEHIRLGNTRALVQEADQPPERENQNHQNYERDDAIPVDLNQYRRRRHRQSTRNNLSSLVDSHTSSGFNSLTVYDHSESSLTSYLAIGRNDFSITSVISDQQNIHSSGYQSDQRRSSAASRSFPFSLRQQADRPITEEEQNNGYTDDNIDLHAQQNSTVRGSEIFSRSSPIPFSAILRPVRENRLSSGENTSTVSLRESTCTQRKEVQSSENTSRSAENAPDDNSHQQVALATPATTASSRPRPQDQPWMLERSTCSAICNDDSSSNGSKEKCPVWSSRSLSHDMCNINRESLKEQGKQAAQYDTTENICKADESNDCSHRNSNHYGSFDRIQRNGNIICQDQAQKSSQGSLLTTTGTEEKNERQASMALASSSLTNDDDLFGEGQSQSPIPNFDLLELTEENREEGEDEVNETTVFTCSTGDTDEKDLPQDD